jgi:hypothetical protein
MERGISIDQGAETLNQSIFSTSLFNWDAVQGEPVVSGYIWIMIVISLGLTIITMLAWHFTNRRDRKREKNKKKDDDDIPLDDMV